MARSMSVNIASGIFPIATGIITAVAAAVTVLSCQAPAQAAGIGGAPPKKQQPKKSGGAKKAPPKKNGPVVLGTTQLAGDFGKLGQTYTVGKSYPLNFTLNSAEYTITPINIHRTTHTPKGDEKLLVLHYTIHNPLPTEQRYYWGEMTFSAVDAQDVTRNFISDVAREGSTESLVITLKPAQKINAYAVIVVPAQGPVPKLIVEREKGAPVVRYDLRDKAKPLPAPFADPADPSGATALKQVPAQMGTMYSVGVFDMRLDSVSYTKEPLGGEAPPAGKRYLTALVTLKNRTTLPQRYYWAEFGGELRDADGEKVPYNQTLLKGTRDESATGDLGPGEEIRVRFFFALPENVAGKTLLLSEHKQYPAGEARSFAFDVSGAQ